MTVAPSDKAARRAAQERVSSYYDSELAILVGHVDDALARYRAREIDVYGVDAVMHQYSKAARKLWAFCWARPSDAEFIAHLLDMDDDAAVSWWERAAPRSRPQRSSGQ